MGLLDIFKKKNPQLKKVLAEIQGQVAPGGKEGLSKIVDELMSATEYRYDRNLLQRVYLYQSTLFTISEDKSKARIVGGTIMRKDFGVDEQFATRVYDFVMKRYARENYGIADDRLIGILSASFGNVPMNCTGDKINGASGPYGRCADNPIPIHGIPQSERYLSHLRTMDGGKITWKRFGSLGSHVTNHPVDMYFIYDACGNEVGKVYISAYQAITSTTAPEGFKYEAE